MPRAPDFFWIDPPTLIARILAPVGQVVGKVALKRMGKAGARAAVPVICVGNPVAGGAGKTPTALALAQLLINMGRCPFFLSRGYGGDNPGPVRVDPAQHSVKDVGDEALLLATLAPTVTAHDRVAGAQLAAMQGADIIIMDDGFQNPALVKDIALLVVDAQVGIGNGLCLPAGPLRAPFHAQLERCQGIVLIGWGEAGEWVADEAQAMGKPVYRAAIAPDPLAAGRLAGQSVLAYAGIGRPQKFADTLMQMGVDVRLKAFPDHHRFTPQDARELMDMAIADDRLLVTTEKDAVRLVGDLALETLRAESDVLPIRLTFEDTRAVAQMVAFG
jgi:tetraacyldisaccharide 4'-kinase